MHQFISMPGSTSFTFLVAVKPKNKQDIFKAYNMIAQIFQGKSIQIIQKSCWLFIKKKSVGLKLMCQPGFLETLFTTCNRYKPNT